MHNFLLKREIVIDYYTIVREQYEFYCTSPYCFEIRIGRDATGVESNTGFSKQYGRVQ